MVAKVAEMPEGVAGLAHSATTEPNFICLTLAKSCL